MTDKELLELAAKAAGIELRIYEGMIVNAKTGFKWNPLADDGDALRLAVNLGLTVDVDNSDDDTSCTCTEVHCGQTQNTYVYTFTDNLDPYAATRRAIVRAAAEIGRAME